MGQQYHVGGIEIEEIEPGIVLVDYGTAIATAERVQDAVDKTREIWGDTRIVVLIEAASATDLARVASVLEAESVASFTAASAILCPGKLAQLLGNLFMKIQKCSYPQRQFTDKGKALVWLRAQLAADQGVNCEKAASF